MATDSPEADHITVSELIAHVTAELDEARQDALKAGRAPTLLLEHATLRLNYEVAKSVGGGLDIKVVQGDAARQRTMGNEITLTFKAASDGMVFLVTEDDGPLGPQGPESDQAQSSERS